MRADGVPPYATLKKRGGVAAVEEKTKKKRSHPLFPFVFDPGTQRDAWPNFCAFPPL